MDLKFKKKLRNSYIAKKNHLEEKLSYGDFVAMRSKELRRFDEEIERLTREIEEGEGDGKSR